jgi:hypothetical protein
LQRLLFSDGFLFGHVGLQQKEFPVVNVFPNFRDAYGRQLLSEIFFSLGPRLNSFAPWIMFGVGTLERSFALRRAKIANLRCLALGGSSVTLV